jgi:hypothetical protein
MAAGSPAIQEMEALFDEKKPAQLQRFQRV